MAKFVEVDSIPRVREYKFVGGSKILRDFMDAKINIGLMKGSLSVSVSLARICKENNIPVKVHFRKEDNIYLERLVKV